MTPAKDRGVTMYTGLSLLVSPPSTF
jgi:hypothetical protein